MPPSRTTPELIAAFRYQVMAPWVSRPLAYGEPRTLLHTLCQQSWPTPEGEWEPLSPRTI